MKDTRYYPNFTTATYSGPAFKLGAGIQGYELYEACHEHGVTCIGGEGRVSRIYELVLIRCQSANVHIVRLDGWNDGRIHARRWPLPSKQPLWVGSRPGTLYSKLKYLFQTYRRHTILPNKCCIAQSDTHRNRPSHSKS